MIYQKIKSSIIKIFPKNFIFRNEVFLRRVYSTLFKGDKNECPICNIHLSKFVSLNDDDLICHRCGSLCRTRRLYSVLEKDYLKDNVKILDFSPSRSIYRKLKSIKNIEYISTSYSGDFFADKSEDITNINENNDEFDIILCYHILEHVKNDVQAMSELYRVLKPKGICIIQTPFKEGCIYEDWTIHLDEDRKIHFGQEDHLRIYSVEGLCERLESVGFSVNPVRYEKNDYYGFRKNEVILFCAK